MSTKPPFSGTGAVYLRVSTDKQETDRQVTQIDAFLAGNGLKVADRYWFEDHGWSRDADRERPEFNRLLALARRGQVQWIVVDSLDRFGTKDTYRLFGYLGELREAGCGLYDASGKEWTAEDDATEIMAWVGGKTSTREQKEKSKRSLGGMIEKAKHGEWLGGPPRLGFDIGCFERGTNKELWRVVFEGRDVVGGKEERKVSKKRRQYHVRRLKVYPDGKIERFDGEVIFKTSKETQVMRVTPTRDTAKLEAVKALFHRYATEAVTFFELSKWLNKLGITTSFGGGFQSSNMASILSDEVYLGFPTFSKRGTGRFHRVVDGQLGETKAELVGKTKPNDPADTIRSSTRLFEPLIDRVTWDAVQKKLRSREKKSNHVPKNPSLYLSGLVVCAGCGVPMLARTERREYHCSTRNKHRMRGTLSESPCERNGVSQELLEGYINKYLEEASGRLELLTRPSESDPRIDRLEDEEWRTGWEFELGLERLKGYLMKQHPREYHAVSREHLNDDEENPCEFRADTSQHEYVDALLALYRGSFDPSAVETEIKKLDAEHSRLMEEWRDLPTPRAREKATAKLTELEGRITKLEQSKADLADVVERHHRTLVDLQSAVDEAKLAMKAETDARHLRQRAESLRAVLCRIDCEFVVSGKKGNGGPGNSRSRLVGVTFVPIAGEAVSVGASELRGGAELRPLGRLAGMDALK